jgi:hypothetical protein
MRYKKNPFVENIIQMIIPEPEPEAQAQLV